MSASRLTAERPLPLRDRLRAIDADRADRQTRLIGALNARHSGALTLAARAAFARDRRAAGAWIGFEAGAQRAYVAPLLVEGELVRLTGGDGVPDPALAARLLPAIEPLLAALEAALGDDLRPSALVTEVPDDLILLRLDASCARHTIRHRLLIALAGAGEVAAAALPAAPPPALVNTLRARWRATIPARAIPAARRDTIGRGDLLLLGIGPLIARLSIPGRDTDVAARLEPSKGSMTLQEDLVPAPDADPSPAAASAPPEWDALSVPACIEIDGGLLSAQDVAGLAAGSVLPLPQTGGTLRVRVVAGGATIGSGELVAVGEGFGVLFDRVATRGEE
ncbi:FliM/FliN family flagellar motor switch protein [uncultured Sphingomonas sp.]|uniref:FliM/FliN family flagellar motor switch protein n=1 Tax=uncultured Sphingomonas sp. TaxID=158754 RepID=UPI0025864132|nr:FliM/FliN family flagellar motor switch protein [uncultured Sphingomonas sp.]